MYITVDRQTKFETLKQAASHAFWESIKKKNVDFLEPIYIIDDEEMYLIPEDLLIKIINRNFEEIVLKDQKNELEQFTYPVNVFVMLDSEEEKLIFYPFIIENHLAIDEDAAIEFLSQMRKEYSHHRMIPIAVIQIRNGEFEQVGRLVYEANIWGRE